MGKSQLYPLIYKPGIKKDGTLFQGDYCTNGQWVRFQRGVVRKMGGMLAFNRANSFNLVRVSNLTIAPSPVNNNMLIYICGGNREINLFQGNSTFHPVSGVTILAAQANTSNYIWKTDIAIQGNNKNIIFLGSQSLENINTNADAVLYYGTLGNPGIAPINPARAPTMTGLAGVLFVNPYVFVYGSNGLVQWSKETAINDFGKDQATDPDRSISIGTDKVLDVRKIRGGVNSPTLLCWTLTSVVRLINTGTSSVLNFQKDVLTEDVSTLSSRCVVEHKGIFFWPGTDRFYQFNGVVGPLGNKLNLNDFYYNLDLDYRQLVFGVKHNIYDEIWWFYPEKGQDPNQAGGVRNTRAIIYNIEDNTWYDTAISRDAGAYSPNYGFLATYGRAITEPNNDPTQPDIIPHAIYRHEVERMVEPALRDEYINEWVPTPAAAPGNYELEGRPIESYFTTPTISWAAFNPMKQLTGVDRWMDITTIEPDFILMPPISDMTVVLNTKQYAQDYTIQSPVYQINSPLLLPTDDPILAKVDVAFQGRQITLTFNSTNNFEMGHIMMQIGIGDGQ